jgi:hypothetical protein
MTIPIMPFTVIAAMTGAFALLSWRQFAWWRRRSGRIDGWAYNRATKLAQLYAADAPVPLFCARSVPDEVQWWLTVINAVTAVPYALWFPRLFYIVTLGGLTLVLAAMVVSDQRLVWQAFSALGRADPQNIAARSLDASTD